jgi:hypothetical protein
MHADVDVSCDSGCLPTLYSFPHNHRDYHMTRSLFCCAAVGAAGQIGDVVLVHDESGLYEQDLDGRLGFVNPVGLDVRTRTGEFLGKVRPQGQQQQQQG